MKYGSNSPECKCGDHLSRHSYEWWLKQQGKTVRITKGSLHGYMGRLSGPICSGYATVTFRTGMPAKAYLREVKVIYGDLEVVDDPGLCCR